MSTLGILGPYFFEKKPNVACSVNSERYREMLLRYVEPLLRTDSRYRKFYSTMWWQQDGVSVHTAKETLPLLRRMFTRHRLISRGTAFPWPPRSPDLTAPDFFL